MIKLSLIKRYQSGQSMIEYSVVLVALTVALLNVYDEPDQVTLGLNKDDENTLMYAVHQRYTAQSYGLRISELPERENMEDIAAYYDELEKFPKLSKKLHSVASSLNEVTGYVNDINTNITELGNYSPEDIKDEIQDLAEDQFENAIKSFF